MRLHLVSGVCGMLALLLGAPAYAVNCYQIWDARENLVYQSILPPFDMARPAFDRAMSGLRAQQRTFIFFDAADCAITGSSLSGPQSAASSDPASLLDIRGIGPGYNRGSGMLSPTPAAAGPGAPAAAPVPATTNVRPSAPTGVGTGRTSAFY